MLYSEYLISFEQNYSKDDHLVNAVENNTSPHLRSDYVLLSRVGHSLQKVIIRRLGR